jgi:hypothetical protein
VFNVVKFRNIITSIVNQHGESIDSDFHLGIESDLDAVVDVSIERHGDKLTACQYYLQQGDLMRDPEVRSRVESNGEFILVYVKCSVEEAKRRDPKGLYEQAVEEKIENFTGINHLFQEPHNPGDHRRYRTSDRIRICQSRAATSVGTGCFGGVYWWKI